MFDSDAAGNGAEKRTAQIGEILKKAGIEYVIINKTSNIKISLFYVLLNAIPTFIILKKSIPLSRFKGIKCILRHVREYLITKKNLHPVLNSESKVFLWECTRSENFFIPLLAKRYGKHLISLPHNLESLVPNQSSSISLKKSPNWFDEEISYLSKCDMSFCISREETLLLKLFGIGSFYLPYYPTEEIVQYLLKIREKRAEKFPENNSKKKILMIGSANNQPTRIGMIDRINFFKEKNIKNIYLVVAGFYTETLFNVTELPDNIIILGSLNNEELEEELINSDAILIHQPASTGALTRIPEMLIAGIPVILNIESARSYYNISGLHIYENDNILLNLLRINSFLIPILPERPIVEEQVFINIIKNKDFMNEKNR